MAHGKNHEMDDISVVSDPVELTVRRQGLSVSLGVRFPVAASGWRRGGYRGHRQDRFREWAQRDGARGGAR